MFGETLLESSPAARKRKRWPMATAFTVESIIAAVIVIVPLLSTGVLPLSAKLPPPIWKEIPLEQPRPVRPLESTTNSGAAALAHRFELVPVPSRADTIYSKIPRIEETHLPPDPGPVGPNNHSDNPLDNLVRKGNGDGTGIKPGPPRRVSVPSEAQLINRVEPVYPKIATITGVQGEVKLHAIIARDGRVIDVAVISGHPLLAQSAVDAVRQWRYRPYYLNGEPIEVETFVTVHFRKEIR